MNFGGILKAMFGDKGSNGGSSSMDDRDMAVAKSWFDAAQSGALDNGSLDIARLYSQMSQGGNAPVAPAPVAAPVAAPEGVSPSTMQLLQPQAAPAINITPPTGTKPGNYRPAQISFLPQAPSALANLGLAQMGGSPFQITMPSGTKPKNYKPATMTMRPPSPVGADAMMQVLASMQQRSPFGSQVG